MRCHRVLSSVVRFCRYEASSALEEALSECAQTCSTLPPPGRMSIVVTPSMSAGPTAASSAPAGGPPGQRSPDPKGHQRGASEPPASPDSASSAAAASAATESVPPLLRPGMTVGYDVPWPLSLVLDSATLDKYNTVFAFLLQVRQSSFALQRPSPIKCNTSHGSQMFQFLEGLNAERNERRNCAQFRFERDPPTPPPTYHQIRHSLSSLEAASKATWKRRWHPPPPRGGAGADSRRTSSSTLGGGRGRDSEVMAASPSANTESLRAGGFSASGGAAALGLSRAVEAAEALIVLELRHFIGSLQSHLFERVRLLRLKPSKTRILLITFFMPVDSARSSFHPLRANIVLMQSPMRSVGAAAGVGGFYGGPGEGCRHGFCQGPSHSFPRLCSTPVPGARALLAPRHYNALSVQSSPITSLRICCGE